MATLQRDSTSSVVIEHVADRLRQAGCVVDVLDFKKEPLALFDPDKTYHLPGYVELQGRVDRADVIILVTPDYHRSDEKLSRPFLARICREAICYDCRFAGEGIDVTDQLRTVARQCYGSRMTATGDE